LLGGSSIASEDLWHSGGMGHIQKDDLLPVPSVVVVGAAIFDEAGQVLAAQRSEPPEMAGWWEFPGGKVEPGEDELAGLVRECREELGVTVEVGERLGGDIPLGAGDAILKVWTARIVSGDLTAFEHAELRWLPVDRLGEVEWLPADAPLVEALQDLLTAGQSPL
jgi:8-oxo-dGTP diphosphatase